MPSPDDDGEYKFLNCATLDESHTFVVPGSLVKIYGCKNKNLFSLPNLRSAMANVEARILYWALPDRRILLIAGIRQLGMRRLQNEVTNPSHK